ncbi:MAG TPA: hypothetical protein VGO74_03305 [Modestobacter sp.]|jgi:hypothetical protein|nr:hypothetical protein [Modestobacter sp.]
MPTWLEAGLWGLLGGGALACLTANAVLARRCSTCNRSGGVWPPAAGGTVGT